MRRLGLLLAGLAIGAWGLWTIGTLSASGPLGAAGTPLFLPLVVKHVAAAETPTQTASLTPTLTPTASATATGTSTSTATVSPTHTPTLTPSSTDSATHTPTLTPSSTPTLTPSSTDSPTRTPTSSATTTPPTPVDTLTPTASATPTATGTSTPTPTPSRTPTTTGTYTSIDLIVVIDISSRMAFGAAVNDPLRDPAVCNTATPTPDNPLGGCDPFSFARNAADFFAAEAFTAQDRLSVITFDREARVLVPLTNTLSLEDLTYTLNTMQVLQSHDPGLDADCHFQGYATDGTGSDPNTDPSNCTGASVGAGLRLAGQQFQAAPARPGAQRVVILISGGAANASELDPDTGSLNRYCPPTDWSDSGSDINHYAPFCRDFDPTTRHTLLDPTTYGLSHTTPYNPQNSYAPSLYDADDYARDNADRVACPAALADAPDWCRDAIDYPSGDGGQGATIYSIGVGDLMVLDPRAGGVADVAAHNWEARIDPSDPRAGYAAGDTLLRYIANVGADGNPDPSVGPDECQDVPPPALSAQPDPALPTLPDGDLSYDCGNYYFANAGSDLYSISSALGLRLWHALLIPPTITPTPP